MAGRWWLEGGMGIQIDTYSDSLCQGLVISARMVFYLGLLVVVRQTLRETAGRITVDHAAEVID